MWSLTGDSGSEMAMVAQQDHRESNNWSSKSKQLNIDAQVGFDAVLERLNEPDSGPAGQR